VLVPLCDEQRTPFLALGLLLSLERCDHLLVLEPNEFIVRVSVAVQFDEEAQCFLVATLGGEKPRCLGNEVDRDQDVKGWNDLDDVRDSLRGKKGGKSVTRQERKTESLAQTHPRPRAVEEGCAKGTPRGSDVSENPIAVIQGGQEASIGRVSDLLEHDLRRHESSGETCRSKEESKREILCTTMTQAARENAPDPIIPFEATKRA
jgi:hypothetical protein